jgi:WD40 repeat protein
MKLLSVAFSPDCTKIAVGGGVFPPQAILGQAAVWDVTSGKLLIAVNANAAVMHVEFSPDGELLATASLDTRATLWDLSTGDAKQTYRDPESGLRRIRFLDQGQTIATLGPRSGISLFAADGKTPHTRKRFDVTSLEEISANADGTLLACGGTDGIVRLWDTRGTEPVIELRAQ